MKIVKSYLSEKREKLVASERKNNRLQQLGTLTVATLSSVSPLVSTAPYSYTVKKSALTLTD